ncbi:scopoletin 8-hydroxylase-like [Impatiens glandulifera]|uniref:scopoletin 8-hydroxylase-like n=1 Tax=Impatiens glandulifera TaxID=253017 RepID=UPI001FB05F2A|nr:scopoletin 8-hydroxylase-like [Impatiens glandulifera]
MAPSFDAANGTSLFEFVVQSGNGVKGLVDSGISSVPDRYIQPVCERISLNKVNVANSLPGPIDLSGLNGPDHDAIARAIVEAAETVGFFQVVNHGIPLKVLELAKETAHGFFNQKPEKKAVYLNGASSSPLVKYGTSFAPKNERALEWKDYLSMTYTNDHEALQHWPNECKEVALEYLKGSTEMVRKIIEVLMGQLGVAKRVDWLMGNRMVNMNFYPACPNPELTVGVGRHSDMGTLTVLLQDGIGGLYVNLGEGNHNEKRWVEVPPVDGALVINVGDVLEILSNGRYKSAEHRVRTTNKECRVSVPVFVMPLATENIEPLEEIVEKDGVARYKKVLYGDYTKNFFKNAHAGKNSLDFARLI